MAVCGISKEYTGLFVNIGGSEETSFKNRTSLLLMYNSKSDFGFTFPVIPSFKNCAAGLRNESGSNFNKFRLFCRLNLAWKLGSRIPPQRIFVLIGNNMPSKCFINFF